MELTKQDYLQAKELVEAYENEVLLQSGIPCYILYSLENEHAIVITDKEIADRVHQTNDMYPSIKKAMLYTNE